MAIDKPAPKGTPPSGGQPVQPSPQAQPGAKPVLGATPKPVAPAAPAPYGRPQPGATSRVTLSKGHAKIGVNFKAQERKSEEERKAREELETQVPVEQRVFAALKIKEGPQPEILSHFLDKVAPKLILPDTSWFILEAFSNIDVTAEKVSQILKANAYFESLFYRVVANLSKREEMPSLEGAIVLLGMQNFRNLMIAAQLYRSVLGTHPEWDKDGKLKLTSSEFLKYSLKTEEQLVNRKNEYSDTAYAAGLVFDILAAVTNAVCDDKKKVLAFLDGIYNHGLRTATIAAELAKNVPDLGFQKYVFSAALIHDIGKVGMAIVRPGYINFLEDVKKKEISRPIRQHLEKEKWGVDHLAIGALTCHFYRMFRPIEKVVQFHHDPYLLRLRQKNLFPITGLICLATNIANNFKKTDKMDDPVLSLWRGPELRDFRIDMRGVVNSVAKNIQI
ncbi:MAG: hypothetical protein A2070_08895 [Bdellovibrionales bacterium GWC1_52_8]|nr:MAG: hypothetical protein A2Z97_09555 [Bdellovibrionales bacterium GWB1_52_6]OFZ03641.1 MAG: hypothetical protein A2X97_00930 [Bdellovibrionales bacterium GWA1_52_35]OFZ41333.1 MAG: hypothetical protein A2070_08895 [Bdellovibrionales bacterium GWC1_52_8]HCM40635.1 hypothetical protein [Bdellovibrionales bacterium]